MLVPGDIISIKLGDIVPGDARLLEGDPLKIDQVCLCGKSKIIHTVRSCLVCRIGLDLKRFGIEFHSNPMFGLDKFPIYEISQI